MELKRGQSFLRRLQTLNASMTEGSLWRGLIVFSLPLMASNLLQVLFNMADVAVVGRFAGSLSLGSVGSTTILVSLFTALLIGMGSGVNVLTARHLGAGHEEPIRLTVHTSFLVSVIYGAALMLVGELLSEPVLRLIGTKDELMAGACLYFRLYLLGLPAMAVYNYGNAVFSAAGDTRSPLLFLSVAGAVNVAMNLFFVIVCRMDVAGVALASVLSQYLSAFLIVRAQTRARTVWRLERRGLRIHAPSARQVLGLGIPAGIQNAIFAVANLFIQSGVNSFSAEMVSGNAAASNADSLVYDVMAAVYTGCSSFMGQNYGAGKKQRVMRSYLISLLYSFLAGLILGLALYLNGPLFLSLFTADPAVIECGMSKLAIMSLSYCVSAFMDDTIAASRALGKTLVPMIMVVLGSCVFRVAWIYTVFAAYHTIASLYLLYVCSWTLTAAMEIPYFLHTYRQILPEGRTTAPKEARSV